MYVGKSSNYFSKHKYGEKEGNQSDVDRDLIRIFQALSGRLRFGSGTSGSLGENLGGVWLQVLTSGTTNTELGYHHTLNSQPMGYIVVWQDKAGSLYANPFGSGINTTWTSGTAYFKADVGAANFMVFLLERGGTSG